MWKIGLAFVAFAALALYILSQGGDIDLTGEKHGIEIHEAESPASAAPPAALAASAAASAQ